MSYILNSSTGTSSLHICFAAIDYHVRRGGGGIASYVDTLGKAAVARNHQVTVIAKGEHSKIEQHDGMQIVYVRLGNLHWYLFKFHAPSLLVLPIRELEWSFGLHRTLNLLLKKSRIDVVEGCETGILFLNRKQKNFPPLVVRLHGEPYVFRKYTDGKIRWGERINRWLELFALRRAAAITSPSRFQAEEVANDLGWQPNCITVIPNPISPVLLQQALQSSAHVRDQRIKKVLYAGRIEDSKGTLPLLQAVPYVVQEYPNVEFLIAGGRHTSIDDSTLDQVLDTANVRVHVKLLGHVPWQQLADWYRQASVFVMPSYYETFGISVIEAMAFGLPVVATTAGGLPEVVEDGVTGILVPPGDSKALAEAIAHLLRDPDLRRRMGEAGRERVLAEFTVDKVVEQTLKVYSSCVNN